MNPILIVDQLSKSFQDTRALHQVSFQMEQGEILAVLGPSGSGKTTLLEIIAGLIEPDSGEIRWDGESLQGKPTYRRGFGLMFQDYALFPHKNIAENTAFGLKMKGWDQERIQERVSEVLELVGLPGFGPRPIHTLSGGEQQRVALARSLAPQPDLLMLDEPLGSLDRTLRERLLDELRGILRELNQTAMYVTHDQVEAFLIADRVVVLKAGETAQIGTPTAIYQHPNSPFIASFLGLTNLIEGEAESGDQGCVISTHLGSWPLDCQASGEITLLLRPDRIQIGPSQKEGEIQITGKLLETKFSGQQLRTEIELEGETYRFDFPASTTQLPEPGSTLKIHFDPDDALQVFPDSQPSQPK